MKVIAIIISASLFLLSTGLLLETLQPQAEVLASACCADCADCCDTEELPQESDKSCHGDSCTGACSCSCDFQISALVYEFLELNGTIVQSYHFVNYLNTYSYEYAEDFLQPPRKV